MADVTLRPLTELDLEAVTSIDEKISGSYRPDEWENRVAYYIRRDAELSLVAVQGKDVVGFMLGEVRSGEFGLEETAGWIEVMGVDPDVQGQSIGKKLLEGMSKGCKARGAKKVRTLVDSKSQEALVKFFEATGFKATPTRLLDRPL